jgi:bifunctional DNA-binding transcriptional regulator/antitoxin component of YhaV-PrlF toxin-antitoxin module
MAWNVTDRQSVMASWTVNVAENGRLCLPVDLRRALDLERGGQVTLEMEDGEVRLLTLAARVRRAQELTRELFAGQSYTVDDFLREKREAAARDAARLDRLAGAAVDERADS